MVGAKPKLRRIKQSPPPPTHAGPSMLFPQVTQVAEKTDIYSFMIFDGDNITDSGEGLFGVVGGQNFA